MMSHQLQDSNIKDDIQNNCFVISSTVNRTAEGNILIEDYSAQIINLKPQTSLIYYLNKLQYNNCYYKINYKDSVRALYLSISNFLLEMSKIKTLTKNKIYGFN